MFCKYGVVVDIREFGSVSWKQNPSNHNGPTEYNEMPQGARTQTNNNQTCLNPQL